MVFITLACAHERAPVGEPLPAPKRVVDPKFGPALTEMKRLVDELVATPRGDAEGTSEQVRAWALEGWMPAQAKRRELWVAIEAARPADADFAGSALLEGRAMESLADDWAKIRLLGCDRDPTQCGSAQIVIFDARNVWLERARERYMACKSIAFNTQDSDKEDFCLARFTALRKPQR